MFKRILTVKRQVSGKRPETPKRLLMLQVALIIWGALSLTIISDYVRGEAVTISFLGLIGIGGYIFARFATFRPSGIHPSIYEAMVLLILSVLQVFFVNLPALILLWIPMGLANIIILAWLFAFLLYDAVFAVISYLIDKREVKEYVVTPAP